MISTQSLRRIEPSPVCDDPLDDVVSGEIISTVHTPEDPPLLRFLREKHHLLQTTEPAGSCMNHEV